MPRKKMVDTGVWRAEGEAGREKRGRVTAKTTVTLHQTQW